MGLPRISSPIAWICLLLVSTAEVLTPRPVEAQEVTEAQEAKSDETNVPPGASSQVAVFLRDHCLSCHSSTDPASGLVLDELNFAKLDQQTATWENVVRRVTARQMPPVGEPRPAESEYQRFEATIIERLDQLAVETPRPGYTESFRRLSRTEYHNAIRDLLGLDIDVAALLPADESSHGFDHITVSNLNPTLLNRYITAAQKISRLALGHIGRSPEGHTVRIRGDVTQDGHRFDGLPLGTRGGAVVRWNFPVDGEYQVQIRLMRDRNDELEGLKGKHQLDLLLDRQHFQTFEIQRPTASRDDHEVDASLIAKFTTTAGEHELGVTFPQQGGSLQETDRQPLHVHFNFYRHPRLAPAVYQIAITGPFGKTDIGNSPSRQRIFICKPTHPADEDACARAILSHLMRQAYRRPIVDSDLTTPIQLYQQVRDESGDFEAGIEQALAAILVNPNFLLRIERQPELETNSNGKPVYRLTDIELASRLSFFLWSSIPDEELLRLAESRQLSKPDRLQQQVLRMLEDRRADALVNNFADQWLYLRNLDAVTPDARLFPDFDHNLREAFRRETELLFAEVVHEDQSIFSLIDTDHTYLNERLAAHYDIPHVQGSHFRRVELGPQDHRGGILRHGSILSVTSYATRTSPVLRGKWILENLLGTPPPPPPANVAALDDNTVAAGLPVRQRLAAHRANTACSGCHNLIDPVGFSLENFDAVGRWRETELGQPVDASGGLPDGSEFLGIDGLERALKQQPDLFARTVAEKLLTYAVGRGLTVDDAPAVRQIVRSARQQDYRFSSFIVGIAQSVPFQLRAVDVRSPK